MSAMTWVALVVAVSMGALALVVLLQVVVTILVWIWRGRRPKLALGGSILRAVAERLAPPATNRRAGPIAAADWLAGAGWGAAVYGLAGPLAMAAALATPSRIDLGVAGFVLGVLGVALVSPAFRPFVRWDGIRASLTAGAVAGASLASGALSGLAAWVEPLGPGVWLLRQGVRG